MVIVNSYVKLPEGKFCKFASLANGIWINWNMEWIFDLAASMIFFSHRYLPVIKHGVLENTLFIGGVPIETLI